MIAAYGVADGKLRPLADLALEKSAATWIDLLHPSPEEESLVESTLSVEVPTREEMEEIEISSRLYADDGAVYMTALVLSRTDAEAPVVSPITFVLSGGRLLTIRYEEPRVFPAFAARAQKAQFGCVSSETVLVGLLEAIIDRLADVVERATQETDKLAREVFAMRAGKPIKNADFQRIIVDLGRQGDMSSKARDSIATLSRLFGFLSLHVAVARDDKDLRARIKTLVRDAESLSDHVSFTSQKITFVLDATLGMINIEQNQIIKIFSIAAVCFLPPTLIASIYGMNFAHMPELAEPVAYPAVLFAMALSAVIPLFYFKKRGWL